MLAFILIFYISMNEVKYLEYQGFSPAKIETFYVKFMLPILQILEFVLTLR